MTRVFYDTEFIENGETIKLISIGAVTEDGAEYYAVNSEMPVGEISAHWWLRKNVVPHLPLVGNFDWNGRDKFWLDVTKTAVKPRQVIANEFRDWLLGLPGKPELWAWYSAYDHVVLAQLWGTMAEMPAGIPWYTNDIKQVEDLVERLTGEPVAFPEQGMLTEHNALDDAKQNLIMFKYLQAILSGYQATPVSHLLL